MDEREPVRSSYQNSLDQITQTIVPLVLREVCYEAGEQRLIDHISCTLEAQAYTIVLGPNGAGKSLLLRLCHGLILPSARPGAVRPWYCNVRSCSGALWRLTSAMS
jgi:ABC-type transport system involved in cytochrome c biogenesis ATPase subunit